MMRQFLGIRFVSFTVFFVTLLGMGASSMAEECGAGYVMAEKGGRRDHKDTVYSARQSSLRVSGLLEVPYKRADQRSERLLPVRQALSERIEGGFGGDRPRSEDATDMSQAAQGQNDEVTLVVDRIEGGEVILETKAGWVRLPIQVLPASAAHEGAVLVLEHNMGDEQKRIVDARMRVERMKHVSDSTIEI